MGKDKARDKVRAFKPSKKFKQKYKDKKLRGVMINAYKKNRMAEELREEASLLNTQKAGVMEGDENGRTISYKQEDIIASVDMNTQKKAFDFELDGFGEYRCKYTRNGRHMLFGGFKGHMGIIDLLTMKPHLEFKVKDKVRDVVFLQNYKMFAYAGSKNACIMDDTGMEIHKLKSANPRFLDFLPYHFLLVTAGTYGRLNYQDVSTGETVANINTHLGEATTLRHNPQNAVSFLGHTHGSVTMWSPNLTKPLVKIQCHKGAVCDLAINREGNHMVTSGKDGQMKVWDLRTYKLLHSYFTRSPASSVDISERGLLAVGFGNNVQVWNNAIETKSKEPYIVHKYKPRVANLRFRPLEDVLGVGTATGIHSMIVPGSGEANYDSYEANPFQTNKQRRETDVRALLDKLPASTIMLNPAEVGQVDRAPKDVIEKERKLAFEANNPDQSYEKFKKKMRGRGTVAKRAKQKAVNVKTKQKESLKEKWEAEDKERKEENEKKSSEPKHALSRFG
eukprot:TRINITY_DN1261_c1_g1_i1.p1 TRINITY_DN1261_c1_g1~~TRINITY_DN1261_c1_g1_i1.p1  ORF type:complete len:536 (+),score=153.32 TRINITY_DN1261_c1_g1_i1:89-1609(+)